MNTEEPGGEQGEANVFDVFAGPDTEPTETEKGATTSDADASEETPPGTTRDKGPLTFWVTTNQSMIKRWMTIRISSLRTMIKGMISLWI